MRSSTRRRPEAICDALTEKYIEAESKLAQADSGERRSSLLEGTGFEPSVPRREPGAAGTSSRSPTLTLGGESSREDASPLEVLIVSRATDG